MKNERDYIQDIAEIRSMMERSSKFLSLSGWAGIMAGIYAMGGAWIARSVFEFRPDEIFYISINLPQVVILALVILIMALVSAIYFSWRKANTAGTNIWNATSKRLLKSVSVPLLSGGVLIVIFLVNGLTGLLAPLSLLFYGLALYNAGHFTISEVKIMGLVQIVLGLMNFLLIDYGLLFWVIGFGVVHIMYGSYMHFRYER